MCKLFWERETVLPLRLILLEDNDSFHYLDQRMTISDLATVLRPQKGALFFERTPKYVKDKAINIITSECPQRPFTNIMFVIDLAPSVSTAMKVYLRIEPCQLIPAATNRRNQA